MCIFITVRDSVNHTRSETTVQKLKMTRVDERINCIMTFYGRNVPVQVFFISLNIEVSNTENYFLLGRLLFPQLARKDKSENRIKPSFPSYSKFLAQKKGIRYYFPVE